MELTELLAPTGANGIGITSTIVNGDGYLTITYSNSFVANAGYVVGPSGSGGNGTTYTVSYGTAVAGGNLSIAGSVITFYPATSYSLPTANSSTLGGVKVDGSSITIDANGTINANNAAYLNGNTASDLRTYTDNKAGNAYSNAIAYAASNTTTYSTFAQNSSVYSNVCSKY